MKRLKVELSSFLAMSLPRAIAYLVAVGGVAGLFAWLLAFGGHLVFETSRPTGTALFWAIPRGALFAVVLGLLLRRYLGRNSNGS